MQDFVEEMIELANNRICLCEKSYNIQIKQILCDAPAKSFILNIKRHSGYFSCTKCVIVRNRFYEILVNIITELVLSNTATFCYYKTFMHIMYA